MNTTNVQTATKQSTTQCSSIEQLMQTIIDMLEADGNKQTAQKCRESYQKWQRKQLAIGFCGLFSAGKSTMINTLLGRTLLPSSPIPTSANVVRIEQGEPGARIQHRTETIQLGGDDWHKWQSYCKDEEIDHVRIFHRHPFLVDGVQFLDTPGIDSNDARHQQATEDALHVADVVYFIADFHHVQSEVNYRFLQKLHHQGKTIVVIINQIDKYDPTELDLHTFIEQLETDFKQWNVNVQGIITTSLKQTDHPANMLYVLKENMHTLIAHKQTVIDYHLFAALPYWLAEHRRFLYDGQHDQRQQLEETIRQHKEACHHTEQPDFLVQYNVEQERIERWEDDVRQECKKIIANAILTPYTTTELARDMIECYQDDFRVSWWANAKKKRHLQQERSAAFHADLQERVQSQLEWHVKALLRKKCAEYELHDDELQQAMMEWTCTISRQSLTDVPTNVDAQQYVHTYTDTLKQRIGRMCQDIIDPLLSRGTEQLTVQHEARYAKQKEKLATYREIERLNRELAGCDKTLDQQLRPLQQLIEPFVSPLRSNSQSIQARFKEWRWPDADDYKKITDALQNTDTRNQAFQAAQSGAVDDEKGQLTTEHTSGQASDKTSDQENTLTQMAETLRTCGALLTQVPALQYLRDDLEARATRLDNQRFRVCLFGAFSAGKSSFANALLGAPVLPVSAQPTTAAIYAVQAPTDLYAHGTVLVRMKSEEQIEDEINRCLERLSLPRQSGISERLFTSLEQLDNMTVRPSLKAYETFLRACANGWEQANEQLGQTLQLQQDAANKFAADEHLACFVADMRLFYDAPLTRMGMELIDTPGADSIYARHTNVTFDFMKHSDAIIYITYYNHAFSRADREFLHQLGSVKDQFALDKMFFLINAADLAESTTELQDVYEYVEKEMLASGIRFPRLYAVSSLKALQGDSTSNITEFQDAFHSFIEDDLTELLLHSAKQDLERTKMILDDLIIDIRDNADRRQEAYEQLVAKERHWQQSVTDQVRPAERKAIQTESAELFYYVKQRLSFALNDYFREAFHPSQLNTDNANRSQLNACLDELTDALRRRLISEAKATSLRMEHVLHRLQDRFIQEWQETLQAEGLSFGDPRPEKESWDVPDIPEQWPYMAKDELQRCLRHFKQPKHFFERGGRESMREEMAPLLTEMIDAYADEITATFETYYLSVWETVEAETKQWLHEHIQTSTKARKSALQGDISLDELEELRHAYVSKY